MASSKKLVQTFAGPVFMTEPELNNYRFSRALPCWVGQTQQIQAERRSRSASPLQKESIDLEVSAALSCSAGADPRFPGDETAPKKRMAEALAVLVAQGNESAKAANAWMEEQNSSLSVSGLVTLGNNHYARNLTPYEGDAQEGAVLRPMMEFEEHVDPRTGIKIYSVAKRPIKQPKSIKHKLMSATTPRRERSSPDTRSSSSAAKTESKIPVRNAHDDPNLDEMNLDDPDSVKDEEDEDFDGGSPIGDVSIPTRKTRSQSHPEPAKLTLSTHRMTTRNTGQATSQIYGEAMQFSDILDESPSHHDSPAHSDSLPRHDSPPRHNSPPHHDSFPYHDFSSRHEFQEVMAQVAATPVGDQAQPATITCFSPPFAPHDAAARVSTFRTPLNPVPNFCSDIGIVSGGQESSSKSTQYSAYSNFISDPVNPSTNTSGVYESDIVSDPVIPSTDTSGVYEADVESFLEEDVLSASTDEFALSEYHQGMDQSIDPSSIYDANFENIQDEDGLSASMEISASSSSDQADPNTTTTPGVDEMDIENIQVENALPASMDMLVYSSSDQEVGQSIATSGFVGANYESVQGDEDAYSASMEMSDSSNEGSQASSK